MTRVYTDADYVSAHAQKSRIFWFFILITVLWMLFCSGWVLYQSSLPYGENSILAKVSVYGTSGVYGIFAYVYVTIKYGRIKRYCKMLDNINEGLKSTERNFFYEFKRKTLQKDNVDVVACLFGVWNPKKAEWTEREVYWDVEKPLPNFENGDLIRYVTQGNVIIEYEIIQRGALEFSEAEIEE